jgi:hypothetical protein
MIIYRRRKWDGWMDYEPTSLSGYMLARWVIIYEWKWDALLPANFHERSGYMLARGMKHGDCNAVPMRQRSTR